VLSTDLSVLSAEFPFVEWGILVSENNTAGILSGPAIPRFPSVDWITSLCRHAEEHRMALSLHVCGRWVRELLLGRIHIPPALTSQIFERIQLNFHAENTPCNAPKLLRALLEIGPQQFIFQVDGANRNEHLEALYGENDIVGFDDAVPLFDISGGAGVVPSEWPKPQYMADDVNYVYHGYAGGLGPNNLETQLPLIARAAGDCRIWIDMETKVRSNNDKLFDLEKVRRCLEICTTWVSRR